MLIPFGLQKFAAMHLDYKIWDNSCLIKDNIFIFHKKQDQNFAQFKT